MDGSTRATILLALLLSATAHALSDNPTVKAVLYVPERAHGSYSQDYVIPFIQSNYDAAIGNWQTYYDVLFRHNPSMEIAQNLSLAYFPAGDGSAFTQYFHDHQTVALEGVFLHYKCDTTVNGVVVPGCNPVGSLPPTQCSGTPAAGCERSSALSPSDSRVPDPQAHNQAAGWKAANLESVPYREYWFWQANRTLKALAGYHSYNMFTVYAGDAFYEPGGIPFLNQTIEYFGVMDGDSLHPRNAQATALINRLKQDLQSYSQLNVNFFPDAKSLGFFPRASANLAWLLSNFYRFSVSRWVSPLSRGEAGTPSWQEDCPQLKDAWNYSNDLGHPVFPLTLNYPLDANSNRTRAFSAAKYYLLSNDHLFYGYSEDPSGANIPFSQWNPMLDVDLGAPAQNRPGMVDFRGDEGTSLFFNYYPQTPWYCSLNASQGAVLARHFENGGVMARWKPYPDRETALENNCPWEKCYASYVDPQLFWFSDVFGGYPQDFYVLQPDGSIPPELVDRISLRTNEAAILLKACPDGVAAATCGCGGEILDSQTFFCCSGTAFQESESGFCTGDGQCTIRLVNVSAYCENPGTCQSRCVLPSYNATPSPPSPTPAPSASPAANASPSPVPPSPPNSSATTSPSVTPRGEASDTPENDLGSHGPMPGLYIPTLEASDRHAPQAQDRILIPAGGGNESRSQAAFLLIAAAAVLAAVLAFHWISASRPRGVSPKEKERLAGERVRQIEAERVQLIKKFMRREMDYAAYARLSGELDKELMDIQARAGER
ncbi:MAG: hypothetical protein V1787_04775 [Candidatus Micrarchaeota archaeon]